MSATSRPGPAGTSIVFGAGGLGRRAASRRIALVVREASSTNARWARIVEKISSSSTALRPASRRARNAARCSQSADGRPRSIGRARLQIPLPDPHEDQREVARIVLDREFFRAASHVPAQFVRPIADVVEMQSVSLQNALLGGEKIDQEPPGIVGHSHRDLSDARLPSRHRRRFERPVDPGVIGAHDFQGEIGFQLAQGHHRLRLRIEIAALADARKMRPRKEMHRPHHRADQPLDMAAEAGRSRRAVHKIDAVLGAGALESQRVEFGAVVDVNDAGYAPRGPFGLDSPSRRASPSCPSRHGSDKARPPSARAVRARDGIPSPPAC